MDTSSGGLWKGLNPQGGGSGWLVAEWKQSPSLTSGSSGQARHWSPWGDHLKSFILQLWFHSLKKYSKEELLLFTHQPWVNCGPWYHTTTSYRNYWSFKDIIMQPVFHLYLTGFARKWYTVKIQSPGLGEKTQMKHYYGAYDSWGEIAVTSSFIFLDQVICLWPAKPFYQVHGHVVTTKHL